MLKKSWFKGCGLPVVLVEILFNLRIDRDTGTGSVAVKCVDITWNTKGEGKYLGFS